MKKFIFFLLMAFASLIILQSFGITGLGKRDGTEPGYTGSPGDTLKNCTACHGGSATNVSGWITSTIPSTGYVPGNTYLITATNTTIGHNRFGFLVSPQAENGNLLGTMEVIDTTQTKLIGNNKYVTYRAPGVFSQDSKSWTFNWTAPVTGTGDVVFYGAFNSNHDGHKGGDVTQLSTLRVKENGTTYTNSIEKSIDFNMFPNPVKNSFTINFNLNKNTLVQVSLFDLSGKKVSELLNKHMNGEVSQQFDLSGVENGIKFVKIQIGSEFFNKRLLVNN